MKVNNYNSRISFQKIPFLKVNKMKFFDEFSCKADEFSKEYRVMCDFESSVPDREFNINVNDSNYLEIGKSNLIRYKDILRNTDIRVFSERRKHSGAGTAMKLGQIMTMVENDINKLELNSLGSAVMFHTMFKFKPAIRNGETIASFMKHNILIHSDDKRFEKITGEAQKWLDNNENSSVQNLAKGNEIIYDYCSTVIKHKLYKDNNYQIVTGGFDMVLSRNDVMKNKDFFNRLFEKFHIDYKI